MGNRFGWIAATLAILILLPFPLPAHQTENTSPQLSAADELQTMPVQDPQGRGIGTVTKLVIDTGAGRLAYVLVAPEAAELGSETLIVPWSALRAESAGPGANGKSALVLALPQDELKQAPKGGIEDVLDPEKGRQVHEFYGVSPYWQEEADMPPAMIVPPSALPPGHPPVLPPGHPPVTPPGDEEPPASQQQQAL